MFTELISIMAEKIYETDFGAVVVRNAMLDLDGTTLDDGVEIKNELNGVLIELQGYRDVEEFTLDELEELIENEISSQ